MNRAMMELSPYITVSLASDFKFAISISTSLPGGGKTERTPKSFLCRRHSHAVGRCFFFNVLNVYYISFLYLFLFFKAVCTKLKQESAHPLKLTILSGQDIQLVHSSRLSEEDVSHDDSRNDSREVGEEPTGHCMPCVLYAHRAEVNG